MYDILRHRAEIRRAINNRRYEMTPGGGILVPSMGAHIGGVFETWINGHDHQVDPNIIPTASLNHILDVVCHGTAQVTTWYVTPFEGDVTPGASYTAANFTSNTTEFTDYDESTRVAWVEAAASAGVTTNSASKADFTIASGVADKVLYVCALLSSSEKSASTGTMLACALFSSARRVNATDVLSVAYSLTLTSS